MKKRRGHVDHGQDNLAGQLTSNENMNTSSNLAQLLAETELLEERLEAISAPYQVLKGFVTKVHVSIDDNPAHRIKWAKSLNLDYILAMSLKPGTTVDGLYGVRNMTEQDMSEAFESFSIKVKDVFLRELIKLQAGSQEPSSTQVQPDTENEGKMVLNFESTGIDSSKQFIPVPLKSTVQLPWKQYSRTAADTLIPAGCKDLIST